MKTIITAILIIVAVAAALFILPFAKWKRTKNRKDIYRNMSRENRRRKTERRVSVETINTR